jgi:hypothetical protein
VNAARFVAASHLRRRWVSVVGFGLVAGVVGALVLGSVAGARRSATVYDRLARATHAPNAMLLFFEQADRVRAAVQQLPQVDEWNDVGLVVGRSDPTKDWYAIFAPSDPALFSREKVVRGRLPDPSEPSEVLITQGTAQIQGIDVGDTIPFHAYTLEQMQAIDENQWDDPAGPFINARVVGIARDVSDAAPGRTQRVLFGTPALTATVARDSSFPVAVAHLREGATFQEFLADALSAARRATGLTGVPFDADNFAGPREAAHQNENVVALSLVLVAAAMALAGSLVLVQAARRHFSRDAANVDTFATLGLTRFERTSALAFGFLPHLVVAVPVTILGAYLLSGAFPVGDLRDLEPEPGLRVDPLVLLAGTAGMVLVGSLLTLLVAARASARQRHSLRISRRSSRLASMALANTPPSVAIGVGFALRPAGAGRALSLRSAQVGTVLAIALAIGAIVFTAGTSRLLDSPDRYGIDYDASLELATPSADRTLSELATDEQLDVVATLWQGSLDLSGRVVSGYAVEPRKGSIPPVVTAGQLPYSANDIALGPALLDDLDLSIGDTVKVGGQELRIVGAVLAPGVEDAYASSAVLVPSSLKALASDEFPLAVVKIAAGSDRDEVLADLDARYPYGVIDESLPEAPPALRKLADVRTIPTMLAVFFVALGAAALVHSLAVATRSQRRELSVLRSLGFTPRQNGGAICAMASVTAALAVVVGVPLGLLIGGRVWRAVVEALSLSEFVVYPLAAVTAISLGAVLLANVVALVPARMAAVQSPAEGLRAE